MKTFKSFCVQDAVKIGEGAFHRQCIGNKYKDIIPGKKLPRKVAKKMGSFMQTELF